MEKIKELRSIRALIVNKIDRSELKEGDHIYCWRSHLYLYAHHGIYIGNEQVIHFTPARGENPSHFAAASWDAFSSVPGFSCSKCDNSSRDREGVCKCCLDCFLLGGELCRFQYNVSRAFLLSRIRAGTCSHAKSSPPALILHRAKYLLERNGFGRYHFLNRNCEHFAIYCSTGLMVQKPREIGQVGALRGFLEKLYQSGKLRAFCVFLRNSFHNGRVASVVAFLQTLLGLGGVTIGDVLGGKPEETVAELVEGLFSKGKPSEAIRQQLESIVADLVQLLGGSNSKIWKRGALANASALPINIYSSFVRVVICYSVARYQADVGIRKDVRLVEVEQLVVEMKAAEGGAESV